MVEIVNAIIAVCTSLIIVAITWGKISTRLDHLEKKVEKLEETKETLQEIKIEIVKLGAIVSELRKLYERTH